MVGLIAGIDAFEHFRAGFGIERGVCCVWEPEAVSTRIRGEVPKPRIGAIRAPLLRAAMGRSKPPSPRSAWHPHF